MVANNVNHAKRATGEIRSRFPQEFEEWTHRVKSILWTSHSATLSSPSSGICRSLCFLRERNVHKKSRPYVWNTAFSIIKKTCCDNNQNRASGFAMPWNLIMTFMFPLELIVRTQLASRIRILSNFLYKKLENVNMLTCKLRQWLKRRNLKTLLLPF